MPLVTKEPSRQQLDPMLGMCPFHRQAPRGPDKGSTISQGTRGQAGISALLSLVS